MSDAGLVQRANMHNHAKCCADRSKSYRDIVIFKLLGCRQTPYWIFLDLKFVTDQTATKAKLRHSAKFRWNRWNCGRHMAIFRFFKMAAAAMFDFWNYKFLTVLTVGGIISVELRYRAKFRGDWSNRRRDITILDFSRRWQPPSWIFEISNFWTVGTVKRVELHHCAKFRQNRLNHGRDMAIFWFFQDSGRPPSWICYACVGTTHEGHLVVFVTVQKLDGIDAVVLIICTFFDFASLGWKRLFTPQNGGWGGFTP